MLYESQTLFAAGGVCGALHPDCMVSCCKVETAFICVNGTRDTMLSSATMRKPVGSVADGSGSNSRDLCCCLNMT
jgi:hypothetical protein